MEYSDSSSDDSVCFGPYTMAEAKRDLKKCWPRKIDRRHSSICRYQHYDISQEIQQLTDQLEEATISSNPSEYCTPNETGPTEHQDSKSSEFLEKLSKAINEPVSEFSFNTACDQSYNVQEEEASSIITISDCDSSASIYELTSDESQLEIASPMLIKQELPQPPEIKITESQSPVQVPEINLNQFDDTCDLDDTLEEINRFLREGENNAVPDNIENLKALASPKIYYSAEKITKPSVDVSGPKTVSKFTPTQSKIKPPAVNARALFSKPQAETHFKLPNKPLKKLTTPNKSLKNVVSPVRIYINHSRKYVPMIKVPQNKTSNKTEPQPPKAFKENIPVTSNIDFPPVIYKPAKTKLVNEALRVKLPESIQKLVQPPTVIKHEQRIASDICNESIERRLMESDLSIDVSQSNQDISIITNKQPFNLRK